MVVSLQNAPAVGVQAALAQQIQARSIAFGSLGCYAVAAATGAIAAGAGSDSELLQFRWTNANLGVVFFVGVNGMRATTAFAAGAIDIKCTIARSFTVAGTGGTSLTLTGN